ncbi:MAG TPA: DUF3667 domain-containing protein, partial [Rubricoccaceae bacterium]
MPAEAAPPACLNCGHTLGGAYCAVCGQKAQSLRQPLGASLVEWFTEYWGLDGRLWRSFRDLVFRPGKLTVDFVEGRRTAALRPSRLYLSATLLFFVTLGLASSDEPDGAPDDDEVSVLTGPVFPPDSLLSAAAAAEALDLWAFAAADQRRSLAVASAVLGRVDSAAAVRAERLSDSLRVAGARFARVRDSVRALPDTTSLRAGGVGLGAPVGPTRAGTADNSDSDGRNTVGVAVRKLPAWLKGDVARGLERARTPAEQDAALDDALEALVGQIPTAMFFVLPVFAALLKLLYVGGGGVELRGRRRPTPPAGAPAGAGTASRAWATARLMAWRTVQAARRRQVRSRMRAARRPWRRALRGLRGRLPARFRAGRVGWLRRAATARRTRFYAEHVVFTLHVHAFTFAVFWLLLLVDAAPGAESLAPWLVAAVPVSFVLA